MSGGTVPQGAFDELMRQFLRSQIRLTECEQLLSDTVSTMRRSGLHGFADKIQAEAIAILQPEVEP